MHLARVRWFVVFVGLIAAIGMMGCTQASQVNEQAATLAESNQPVSVSGNEFQLIQQEVDKYLKQNNSFLISAKDVYENIVLPASQEYFLVDLRNKEHYAKAHIAGAVNIPYSNEWRENKVECLPKDKQIVLVCYSGHTAAQAAATWGLLGYDVVVMKDGMSGWSKKQDIIGSVPLACAPHDYPVVADTAEADKYEQPEVKTEGITTFAGLVLDRTEQYFAKKPSATIKAEEIKEKVLDGSEADQYILVDIRGSENYDKGHIKGAINIPLAILAETENLAKLSDAKKVVLIDYDGHAASMAARMLNLLGYDAVPLKNGMSIWTADEAKSGIRSIACNVTERPTMVLNANIGAASGAPAS